MRTRAFPRLSDLLAEFADALASALRRSEETDLERQVGTLRVYGYTCESTSDVMYIYTEPRPSGSFGLGLRMVTLEIPRHLIVLDVVSGRIAGIEVIGGSGRLRSALREEWPEGRSLA